MGCWRAKADRSYARTWDNGEHVRDITEKRISLVELKTGQTNHLVMLRAVIKATIFRESRESEYN